jgi:hypothetical protein
MIHVIKNGFRFQRLASAIAWWRRLGGKTECKTGLKTNFLLKTMICIIKSKNINRQIRRFIANAVDASMHISMTAVII